MGKELDTKTEEQILAAAGRVIVQKGKAGARMQEIADAAGVNKALLHYYFRSKDRIYEAVLRKSAGQLFSSFLVSLDFELPIRQLLQSFVRSHIAAIRDNQANFNFLFSEIWTNRDEVLPIFEELLRSSKQNIPQLFAARVQQAVRDGEIRLLDPFHLLMNIISMDVFYFAAAPLFFGLMRMSPEAQRRMSDERADQVFEFIWESIRSREEE